MAPVYIGVGSNIEPLRNIPAAIKLLREWGITVFASSTFYRTPAIGRPEQEPYANGVWLIEYARSAWELKALLRKTEEHLGRVRTEDRYAPRSLDLDILLFGDLVTHEKGLIIPDPHITERPFLCRCLLELDPAIRMPESGRRLSEFSSADWLMMEEHAEITKAVRRTLEMKA